MNGFFVVEKMVRADCVIRSDDLVELITQHELQLKRTHETLETPKTNRGIS